MADGENILAVSFESSVLSQEERIKRESRGWPRLWVLKVFEGYAVALDAGAEGAGDGLGLAAAGGSAFLLGARIAWRVVPSMRGMNSTTPASPMSWMRRLMIL